MVALCREAMPVARAIVCLTLINRMNDVTLDRFSFRFSAGVREDSASFNTRTRELQLNGNVNRMRRKDQ